MGVDLRCQFLVHMSLMGLTEAQLAADDNCVCVVSDFVSTVTSNDSDKSDKTLIDVSSL